MALLPYARYEIGERWFLDAGLRYLSAGEVTMDGEGAGKCATPRPVEKIWAQRPKQVFAIEIDICARCHGRLR